MPAVSGRGAFLIAYQVLLLLCLPFYLYYAPPSLSMILASIALFALTGISITTGYHRFYAHRAYDLHRIVELPLLFFGTMAMQGSVLDWAHNHRMHHRFTDTEQDPHSIKKGFWYAHMAWMLGKGRPIDDAVVQDLSQDRLLRFQHRHFGSLTFATNAAAFIAVGWMLRDFIGAFFLAWWTRLFVLHHVTWFINSLAHTWGSRTFSREQSAVDNYLVALLTFGEGYHNYHHVFASDYRNGTRWYHFDPSKWLVWTLNKLGLARNVKEVSDYTAKRRMIEEDKHLLLARIQQSLTDGKEAWHAKVHELSASLASKIDDLNARLQDYRQKKAEERQKLRSEIQQLKQRVRAEWRAWIRLSHGIMSLQ